LSFIVAGVCDGRGCKLHESFGIDRSIAKAVMRVGRFQYLFDFRFDNRQDNRAVLELKQYHPAS
jgi:hypothetical protein